MQPDEVGLYLNEEQMEQFKRHLSSKSVNLTCPFCGYGYDKAIFVSVPALLNSQPLQPVSWTRPLVQVTCVNCGHAAHFSIPIEMPSSDS